MKKSIVKRVVVMGTTAALFFGSLAVEIDVNAAKKLSVSAKKITLEVGNRKTVKTNMSAKFSVSDKRVVSLKNVKKKQCSVVARKNGSCIITVKAKKQVKKIKVTVSKKMTPSKKVTPKTENLTMEDTINYFGFDMMKQLDDGKNVVISPYSIMMAMTMVDNAADGDSKSEIEKALGMKDLEQWNKEFSEHYKKYMNQPENQNTCILRAANSIWKNEQNYSFDSVVQKTYMEKMLELYGAEEKNMDFVNGNPKDQINSWVDEKTEGMIKELFQADIEKNVQNVLVNAVYFNGKWQDTFNQDLTEKKDFNGKNETTKVDMMHQYETNYRYLKKGTLEVAEIPFKGDNLVMDVVLAEKKASTVEEFGKLSNEEKTNLFKEVGDAKYQSLDVCLPKFEMSYGTQDLIDNLKNMGMVSVFSSEKAELPGLKGNNINNVYVDKVLHKAVMKVDEGGAKAAAATGVCLGVESAVQVKTIEFNVNKPFICVLRDKNTNLIYFMGQIEDLTQEHQIN